MADTPSGTCTFFFTDIEGSTQLWEQHPETMRVALAQHDATLRQAIEQHRGFVFKTAGDSFCAAFGVAAEALRAAIAAQLALQREVATPSGPLRVRIALHTGAAEYRDHDYFGPPLNRVARLLQAAHGGQILLSSTTKELARERLPVDATLRDLGEHRLRDIARGERVFQLCHPELPSEFPPIRSLDASVESRRLQQSSFIRRQSGVWPKWLSDAQPERPEPE